VRQVEQGLVDLAVRGSGQGNVCAIGRSPASASPPVTPMSSCSRMPTLITRPGWRAEAGANCAAVMSASTTAIRGSLSSRSVAVATKRSRMVSMAISQCLPGGPGPSGADVRSRAGDRRILGLNDRHHGARPPGVRGGQRGFDAVVVAPVDGHGRPALALEPGADAAGPAMGGRGIVDDDSMQAVQAGRASRLGSIKPLAASTA
jgi:hypothetical protein